MGRKVASLAHDFDPGYGHEPFATLCRDYPGVDVYPPKDFRVEWGPIFHRGRLDGSARVLVIGQDPGAHEAIARRILVGEAGQRIQGFLAKLGIETSYVMVNAFVYSVFGQGGGERHRNDPAIAAYRNRWLDALLVDSSVEVIITIGGLAKAALEQWKQTPGGQASSVPHAAIIHPTFPESASAAGQMKKAAAVARLLDDWNQALTGLAPQVRHPDRPRELTLYGTAFDKTADLAPIPEIDLPPGIPEWMRSLRAWAVRKGATRDEKRATVVVTVPRPDRIWLL
jgi:hypothetical protein